MACPYHTLLRIDYPIPHFPFIFHFQFLFSEDRPWPVPTTRCFGWIIQSHIFHSPFSILISRDHGLSLRPRCFGWIIQAHIFHSPFSIFISRGQTMACPYARAALDDYPIPHFPFAIFNSYFPRTDHGLSLAALDGLSKPTFSIRHFQFLFPEDRPWPVPTPALLWMDYPSPHFPFAIFNSYFPRTDHGLSLRPRCFGWIIQAHIFHSPFSILISRGQTMACPYAHAALDG